MTRHDDAGCGRAAEPAPAGPLQQGLWTFWNLNPSSAAYNMPDIVDVDAPFALAAAQAALEETLRRHEALRTTFAETASGVVQCVAPEPVQVAVTVVDLRDVDPVRQPERFAVAVDAAANAPFDLATGPLVTVTAVRFTDNRTSYVVVAHHIVCDGASMSLLTADFLTLLHAARTGTPAQLPLAPPAYREFVQAQLVESSGSVADEDLDFWRRQLNGARGSALPGSGGAADTGTRESLGESLVLDPALAASVHEYARRVRTTPFAVLLCAMQVLTALASGDGDVVLGTASEARPRRFAETVGMFANTLVIRSAMDLGASFDDLLVGVSADLIDALDHRDLPYARVVAALTGRDIGDDLIRTMFTAGAGGSSAVRDVRESGTTALRLESPFDLIVLCQLDDATVTLDWDFAARIYDRRTAAGYVDAYRQILAAVLRRPDAPITSLGAAELPARYVPTVSTEAPVAGAASQEVPGSTGDSAVLSGTEAAVAGVWETYLDVPVVSPTDDFFALGGHSMIASQVVAVLRRTGVEVTLRTLFDHPQLRDFCARVSVHE